MQDRRPRRGHAANSSGPVARLIPTGTEIDPEHWWTAFKSAEAEAGGLDDVAAIAVGGQQHGMVCLDESGAVVRPALLWNDTRSAPAALELIDELGGPQAWADAIGFGAGGVVHRDQVAVAGVE